MKAILLVVLFAGLILIPYELFPVIRKVPTVYLTIQNGIDNSNNGDTVLVEPGTYYEHLNLNGKNIVLCSKYLTTSNETYISSTIIDGSKTGRVVNIENGENSNCRIVGFTIQNGKASDHGGGIRCWGTSPIIERCRIMQNEANEGGGVYLALLSCHAVVMYCDIAFNLASFGGGGVRTSDVATDAIIRHCIIRNNIATSQFVFNNGGGGVQLYHRGKLDNCLIINNTAPQSVGGGVFCDWGSYYGSQGIFIKGCTIAYNSAKSNGGINYICQGGLITNSIIYNNTDIYNNPSNYGCANLCWGDNSFDNCCTSPLPAGSGNISSNPAFIDPTSGNFRLLGGSPCINVGNNAFNCQAYDLNGNPRIIESNIDIGCYENNGIFNVVSYAPSGNALNIPANSSIQVFFNYPINTSTTTKI